MFIFKHANNVNKDQPLICFYKDVFLISYYIF